MTSDIKFFNRFITLFLLCCLLGIPALAQDETEEAADDAKEAQSEEPGEWKVYIEPLLWLPSTTTDYTLGNGNNNVDFSRGVDAVDALSKLQFAAMGRVGANNGKWGAFGEMYYLSLSDSNENRLFTTDSDVKTLVYQIAGTYRLADKENFDFDAVFGVRGMKLDLDAQVRTPGNLNGGLDASASANLLDPIVGGQGTWKLSDTTDLIVYGDVGGFGLGSDFTWRASAAADFQFNKTFSLDVGYQAMGWKFNKGSGLDTLDLSTTLHGPLLGFKFNI